MFCKYHITTVLWKKRHVLYFSGQSIKNKGFYWQLWEGVFAAFASYLEILNTPLKLSYIVQILLINVHIDVLFLSLTLLKLVNKLFLFFIYGIGIPVLVATKATEQKHIKVLLSFSVPQMFVTREKICLSGAALSVYRISLASCGSM